MPSPRFQATANIGERQRFLPFALALCPRLQPFQLGLQTVLLPMPADPSTSSRPSSLPTIRSISARGMRTSRPIWTTWIRPALIHRRTVIGCKPNSCAALVRETDALATQAVGIPTLLQSRVVEFATQGKLLVQDGLLLFRGIQAIAIGFLHTEPFFVARGKAETGRPIHFIPQL